MSTTTFNLRSYVNGLATDLTSIKFQDTTATYGAKRTDTQAVVIASGTDWTRIAQGVYQHILTDPAAGLIYDYVIRIVLPAAFSQTPLYYARSGDSTVTIHQIYAIPTTDYYSSEAEVMRFIGQTACELMMEDWEASDVSPVWNDILAYIDETIDMMLGQKYDRVDIISNSYVRRRATILAAHLLSMRRGNPAIYKLLHDQVIEEFRDIQTGRFFIPSAVPFARNAPVVRNYIMQPLAFHPQRILKTKSTGATYPSQDHAFEPFIFIY